MVRESKQTEKAWKRLHAHPAEIHSVAVLSILGPAALSGSGEDICFLHRSSSSKRPAVCRLASVLTGSAVSAEAAHAYRGRLTYYCEVWVGMCPVSMLRRCVKFNSQDCLLCSTPPWLPTAMRCQEVVTYVCDDTPTRPPTPAPISESMARRGSLPFVLNESFCNFGLRSGRFWCFSLLHPLDRRSHHYAPKPNLPVVVVSVG